MPPVLSISGFEIRNVMKIGELQRVLNMRKYLTPLNILEHG